MQKCEAAPSLAASPRGEKNLKSKKLGKRAANGKKDTRAKGPVAKPLSNKQSIVFGRTLALDSLREELRAQSTRREGSVRSTKRPPQNMQELMDRLKKATDMKKRLARVEDQLPFSHNISVDRDSHSTSEDKKPTDSRVKRSTQESSFQSASHQHLEGGLGVPQRAHLAFRPRLGHLAPGAAQQPHLFQVVRPARLC